MKILTFCILACMGTLFSCSSQSDKKPIEGNQREEDEYTAPSTSPNPIPGVDPSTTAIALR